MSQQLLQDVLQGFVAEENLYSWLTSDVTDNVSLHILFFLFELNKIYIFRFYQKYTNVQRSNFLKTI